MPVWTHLNELHLQWSYCHIRSCPEIVGVKIPTYLFGGGYNSTHNKLPSPKAYLLFIYSRADTIGCP